MSTEQRWVLWGFTKGCRWWCDVITGLSQADGEAELESRRNGLAASGWQTRLVLLPEGEDPHRRWPRG